MRAVSGLRPAALAITTLVAIAAVSPQLAQAAGSGWKAIDYGALVDGRQLSHSGEPVAALLEKLEGRPLPTRPGERRGDLTAHILLDPLLEPYAFVLSDALDWLSPAPDDAPWVEIGSLWQPGEPQPAWAELLRARAMILESDGQGRIRAILPVDPLSRSADSKDAARAAWEDAWPVVRLALGAEQRRLAGLAKKKPEEQSLEVTVHAFVHEPARTRLEVGLGSHKVVTADFRPTGDRPPLDLDALQRFVERGLRLEGARLTSDGQLFLFGSESARPPTLHGQPVSLADYAVAYRAVFHGGVGEPYMSLDRGLSPQTMIVNYGGRLRDTALGMVSLLCDVRFKTFSQGIDPVSGRDIRDDVRQNIPGFRVHVERLAADPRSLGVPGQQTRLWFYPDSVEMVLSERGDLMALSRARMTAASERVEAATMKPLEGEDPPWTRDTIAEINKDYDALAGVFPELAELDEAVRLLSLFSWLRQARVEGLPTPELDALLAVELPALTTPRRYPQLLAFDVLPAPESEAAVIVLDRSDLAEALDRLASPGGRDLPAERRFRRALAALDASVSDQAALLQDLRSVDPAAVAPPILDALAYRAERLRMHWLTLNSLSSEERAGLQRLSQAGQKFRVFSLGIGGLDLGMGTTVSRAARRSSRVVLGGLSALGFVERDEVMTDAGRPAAGAAAAPEGRRTAGGAGSPAPASAAGRDFQAVVSGGVANDGFPGEDAAGARDQWRVDPPSVNATVLPSFGSDESTALTSKRTGGAERRAVQMIYGPLSPDVRARTLSFEARGKTRELERVEDGRLLRFRFVSKGDDLTAEILPSHSPERTAPAASAPPEGLLVIETLLDDADGPAVRLRLRSAGAEPAEREIPRGEVIQLVLGRDIAASGERAASESIPTIVGVLGGERRLMFLARKDDLRAPWEADATAIPGEEDPVTLADAVNRWWEASAEVAPLRAAVVGVDPAQSPGRWKRAPAVGGSALLLAPDDAFPGATAELRERLVPNWKAGPAAAVAPREIRQNLVVLVSAEPPALLARRLRALAGDPALDGRLLAVLSLGGPIRRDLPASLLAAGRLAGLGVAEAPPAGQPQVLAQLLDLATAFARPDARERRPEEFAGPFVWTF